MQNMEAYERSKLADAIQERWFEVGDYVITEGQEGDSFFMISLSSSPSAWYSTDVITPTKQSKEFPGPARMNCSAA